MERRNTFPTGIATTLLVVGAAVSAGVHAGLAPEHLREWPPLGASFVAAATAAAVLLTALVQRPASRWPARLLAALLAGLIVGYVATRLAAVPLLDPEREPFDALGVGTAVVEAVALLAATRLGWSRTRTQPSYALTEGGTA